MSNDPDPRTISEQKHAIDCLKSLFHSEFPHIRSNEIEAAIEAAKRDSDDRDAIEARVREILANAS